MGILDGKAVVVTGGGRGIGRGHCLHLAEQGASVVVNDIDIDEAKKVVNEISEQGGKATANDSNVSTREGARALVQQCVDEFGAINAAVNNAGNMKDRSFLKMSDEEFDAVLQVHVYGTFRVSQEACLRFKPEDFDLKTNTDEGGDFPFSYETLDPYYYEAERYLSVCGNIEESWNKNELRLRHPDMPYPRPPFRWTEADGEMIEAWRRAGIEPGMMCKFELPRKSNDSVN